MITSTLPLTCMFSWHVEGQIQLCTDSGIITFKKCKWHICSPYCTLNFIKTMRFVCTGKWAKCTLTHLPFHGCVSQFVDR